MRKRKLLRALLIGISSSIIITIISHIGYLEFLQRKSIDFMVWWKDEEKASDIAIVAIDNEAYEYLGKKTPLPRDKLAILIDFLIRCKARVISVDVEFRDKTSPEKDELLISVLDSGKMVTPYSIMPSEIPGRYKRLPLFYAFKDTLIGYANVYTDDDGLIRRSPLTLRDEENNPMRSFGLQTYLRYSGNSGNREYLSETRDSGIIRINYSGPAGTFPHYPARPFLMMAEAGLEPPSENPFSDKLVFIGATFGDSRNFFLTPNGPMSGVEIHANIVNTLLTAKEIRTLTWPLMFLIQFTLCMIVSVLFAFLRVWKTIIISVSGLVLIFIPLSYLAYVSRNYWIDFTLPFAAIMMISVTNNYLEKRRIRRSFSQYVSKEVVDRIY